MTFASTLPSYTLSFLKTLWLFSKDDLKTFMIPQFLFAMISAFSGSALTTNASPDFWQILSRAPQTLLWIWLNLIIFNLSNQRLPGSVMEDKHNKPHRPIPAGRITAEQATQLLMLGLPIVYFAAQYLGGSTETSMLLLLNWIYNDLGAGDAGLARSIVLALAIPIYGSGASRVAIGPDHTFNQTMYHWLFMIALVIEFTQHVQDLRDQEGDAARGRTTLPIMYGDEWCRNSIVVLTFISSIVCLVFWTHSVMAWLVIMGLNAYMTVQVLLYRDVAHDKKAYKIWALWLISMYFLPLLS